MPEKRKTQANIDPHSPLVFDTRELGRRPGSMTRLRRPVPAPDHFSLEMIGIPKGSPLELDLRFESVAEGVLVSGSASAATTGECGRCLQPVTSTVLAHVQELFVYPDNALGFAEGDEEVSQLEGDLLDFEPLLRDAVVLALPVTPLCSEDCPGLCSMCGVHWDELPSDHNHDDQLDPRWAELQMLIDESPERATRSQEN